MDERKAAPWGLRRAVRLVVKMVVMMVLHSAELMVEQLVRMKAVK